jgi:hypothetical protein
MLEKRVEKQCNILEVKIAHVTQSYELEETH